MNRHERADAALSAPDSKAGKLQRACLALLQEHEREGMIPTNGRFLFYELEQRGVVPKAYRDASGNANSASCRGGGLRTRAATCACLATLPGCTSTWSKRCRWRASTVGAGSY